MPPVFGRPPRRYNLDGLSKAVIVLLVITAVTGLLSILATVVLFATTIANLALIVVFLIWINRARHNASSLDMPQRWGPGWAVGWWFIPVCFLWLPYQVVLGIWRANQPPEQRSRFPFLLAAWWAYWCLSWFTGYRHVDTTGGAGAPGATATQHSVITTVVFDGTVASKIFAAAAAVLLAVIVRQILSGPVGRVGADVGPVLAGDYR